MKPLVIDLCCGLGGWTRGFLSEGWEAIGFDIEKHEYGDKRYPGELILRDITTLCGYDLRCVNPALVVASPPCQNYSYMAMPWSRAKAMAAAIRADQTGVALTDLNRLYNACFRIARELGVPIVLENVKGAQPWVGRAQANYGSYYLWGDVANVGGRIVRASAPQFGSYVRAARRGRKFNPDGTEHGQGSWFAIADSLNRGAQKREGRNFHAFENGLGSSPSFNGCEHETRGVKTVGHANQRDGFDHTRHLTNQRESDGLKFDLKTWDAARAVGVELSDGVKQAGLSGEAWFNDGAASVSSRSDSRKAASAMIAEIPFELANYIARCFDPRKIERIA